MAYLLYFFLLLATSSAAAARENKKEDKSLYKNTTFLHVTHRDVVFSTPTVIIIGKKDGKLNKCLKEHPQECETIMGPGSYIYAVYIAGSRIYAGLKDGRIFSCPLYELTKCVMYHDFGSKVNALTGGGGHLYVGLITQEVHNCKLDQKNSCTLFSKFSARIWSVIEVNRHLYVGLNSGRILRCLSNNPDTCIKIHELKDGIMDLASMGNTIFGITERGRLWNISLVTNAAAYTDLGLVIGKVRNLAVFNGKFYVATTVGIHICVLRNGCSIYKPSLNSRSIQFAYSTHHLQSRYKNEQLQCTWQDVSRCPPYVFYYNSVARALFEVHVKDGVLHDFEGYLVDTSRADDGHSGPVAIFVMGPNGRIYLSNSHKKGLIETSSLFSGDPVAGAGEMVVRNGVIKRMTACSEHYQANVDLNKQVVQSLRNQGYNFNIDSRMCHNTVQCE